MLDIHGRSFSLFSFFFFYFRHDDNYGQPRQMTSHSSYNLGAGPRSKRQSWSFSFFFDPISWFTFIYTFLCLCLCSYWIGWWALGGFILIFLCVHLYVLDMSYALSTLVIFHLLILL